MSMDAANRLLSSPAGLASTVEVHLHRGKGVSFTVDGETALQYLRTGVAVPRLDRARTTLRYVKLTMPLHEAIEAVSDRLNSTQGVIGEDGRTYSRVRLQYSHHVRRCHAYDPSFRRPMCTEQA